MLDLKLRDDARPCLAAAPPDPSNTMPPVSTKTSATLLMEVRDSGNADAWAEFEYRYRELLVRFCRSLGVQHADAEDIVQRVFSKLVSGLGRFEYDPGTGRFRDYLFCCVRSGLCEWAARPKPAGLSAVPQQALADGDAVSELLEREWIFHHYRAALAAVRQRVDTKSVAVLEATLAGSPVPAIAHALAMTDDAVYKCQQRMRAYLKEQIALQIREEDSTHG